MEQCTLHGESILTGLLKQGIQNGEFITLLLVPVFYSIFVLDLKWIKWETTRNGQETTEAEPTTT
jgi:hypothetical protein